jgi:formate/nitrite transporter FocA (FNT family)
MILMIVKLLAMMMMTIMFACIDYKKNVTNHPPYKPAKNAEGQKYTNDKK